MSKDADGWMRVRSAFEGALELDPAERARYLDRACGSDAELRAEVEELLRRDGNGEAQWQPPWRVELDVPDAVAGRRIGPYEVERVIGRGGMGTVYLAHRADEHFRKRVALKLIRRGMDTDDILRRFRNERQVLADLEHPGIARLLDGGATEDGRPYLVLEYVEGQRLDAYCDRCRLGTRSRLELFREVCAAVHHAHEHRVVHRDLKPSNILVTTEGRPKLLDFGIAKVLDPEPSDAEAERTATGQRLFTPEYASPEHVRGGAISAASDVFGLGVILYELLSGHRPHTASVESPAALVRAICEEDPPPPSACVGRSVTTADGAIEPAHLRDATTARLRRILRGDLDTIVLMALRNEPERRYRTAAALAEDIGRYLAGQPLHARRDAWRYRAVKFVRRNGLLVGATATLVAAVAGGLAMSLNYKARSLAGEERARREKERADAEADTARRTADEVLRLAGWLEQVGAGLHSAELRFAPVAGEPGTWSAPNRAHELRSRVSAAGLEVFPRKTGASGAGAAWKLTLATSSFGRAGDTRAVACRGPSVVDTRAELDHGILAERLENSERGFEQGWTVAQRPAGSEALEIGLAVSGDLSLRLDGGGRSGVFVDGAGNPRVSYRELRARDATGRELPARLEPGSTGVVIRLGDAGAVHPITVDLLLTNPAWTAESNQAGAQFGFSASTAGDVNGDGYSDVIVGAHQYDNGQADEGRVFVFHGSASGLAPSPAWTAEPDQQGALFGGSLSTAGDVNGDGYSDVIVGAYGYDNGQTDEGRVFVYHGSASGLAPSPAWTAESDQESAWFGRSVSTAGDVNGDGYSDVIVGANQYDNGQTDEGCTFVYHGSASGLATSPAWTAESDQAGGELGNAVSTAGDVNGDGYSDVIVGATFFDDGERDEGRACVYHGSASGLAESPAWTVESDQTGAQLGRSVSTAGDVNADGYSDVIVGANVYDNGEIDEGRAYLYHGSSSGLATSPAWTVESDQAVGNLGISVATVGDVNGDGYSDVIVGADRYDAGQTDEGRVYVYHGSASGISASPVWTAESDQASAWFGRSVSSAGDVNGDGYSDVIVGAWYCDNGQMDEGRAYEFHGSAGGLTR